MNELIGELSTPSAMTGSFDGDIIAAKTYAQRAEAAAERAEGVVVKSAYEYAKDGGYTGTEAEFAEKLARETDTTLTKSGYAADAKYVGIALKGKQTAGETVTLNDKQLIFGTSDNGAYAQYASNDQTQPYIEILGTYGDDPVRIGGIATPVESSDAVPKKYVDEKIPKSAYEYAVDGGYSGTEAEFSVKLASGAVVVTVTDDNGTLSADKTFPDILRYFSAGIPVYVDYCDVILSFIAYSDDFFFFGTIVCENDDDGVMVGTNIIGINANNEVIDISAGIDRMPNPNALTIKIGDTTVVYDGSEVKTVTIADGSEVSY